MLKFAFTPPPQSVTLLAVIAAVALTSCGDPDAQLLTTTQRPLIYSGLNVGDGFDPSFPNLIPASAAECFDEVVSETTLPGNNRYYAFRAFSADEARTKFIELARPQNSDPTLPQTLHDLMYNEASGNTPYLILAVQIDTHKDRMGSSLEAAKCNVVGGNLDEFVYNCGTQYLDDQTYGGYIFLITPITTDTMDNEQYDAISRAIHVNIQKHGKSAADALADIASITSDQLAFQWAVWGLPAPGSSELEAVRWPLYESDAEHSSAYSYNEVLHQTFKQFTASILDSCGVSGDADVREALDCYREFHDITNNPQGNPQIAALIDQLDWALNSPDTGRLIWTDATNDPKAWQDLKDEIEECLDPSTSVSPVSAAKVDCDGAMAAGITYLRYVCAYCQVPDQCDPATLFNRFDGLPKPIVAPVTTWTPQPVLNARDIAEPHTVGHNSTKIMRNYSTHICTLSGMQGKMAGGGEAARVSWASGDWYVDSDSGQNALSNRMSVHAHCAPRNWFTTNGNPVTSWYTEVEVALSTNGGAVPEIQLDTGAYAAALSGIKGKMDNENARAVIATSSSASTASELDVYADNYFQAHATTFGVDHNASLVALVPNPTSRFADTNSTDPNSSDNWLDSYIHKVMLSSTDDSFCYLTRVQGRFDGNGEGVRIVAEDNYWYLIAKAGCEQRDSSALLAGAYPCADWKRVQAIARCYKYNQN